MREAIYDIQELTDSREMLEAKPHPFIAVFMYILMTFLAGILIWAYYGEKEIVVKGNAVIRPNENVSTIRNKVLGKVKDINFVEGQSVRTGDVLFTIETEDLEVQEKALRKELETNQKELQYLNRFREAVETDNNLFTPLGEQLEKEYYYKFIKYKTEYNKLDVKLSQTKRKLDQLLILEESILQGINLFNQEDRDFYFKVSEYLSEASRLQTLSEQKRKEYELSQALGEQIIPRSQIENQYRQAKVAELELRNYQDKYLVGIRAEIESTKKELNELEFSLKRTFQSNESATNSNVPSSERYKLDTLLALNDAIREKQSKIKDLEEQLNNNYIAYQDRIVRATINGKVKVITEINRGDLLQTGSEILTIVPEENSQYKVQISVPNKGIADIKEGDTVRYNFLALPHKEYGELKGTVRKISSDATIDQQGNSFYMVEATIENKPLYDHKGREANLKVGMVAEASIVTKSKKILFYLLEKINLKE